MTCFLATFPGALLHNQREVACQILRTMSASVTVDAEQVALDHLLSCSWQSELMPCLQMRMLTCSQPQRSLAQQVGLMQACPPSTHQSELTNSILLLLQTPFSRQRRRTSLLSSRSSLQSRHSYSGRLLVSLSLNLPAWLSLYQPVSL